MSVRDWFDSIHEQVTAIAESEKTIQSMRLSIGSHGQSFGPISKGSVTDQSAAIISVVVLETELDVMRARLEPELDRALAILYGTSGRGGLARARDFADADCICGYYLMGMTWAEVASELTAVDGSAVEVSFRNINAKHLAFRIVRFSHIYKIFVGTESHRLTVGVHSSFGIIAGVKVNAEFLPVFKRGSKGFILIALLFNTVFQKSFPLQLQIFNLFQ